MKRAREEGDVDREFQLINELAEVKAKKTTNHLAQHHKYERQEQQLRQMQEEAYVPIETSPAVAPSPPVNEHFQDWVEENPWFEENPRLRKEAEEIGQDLAARLSFNRKSHEIGTPDFYDSINKLMSDRYKLREDDAMSNQVDENPYMQQAGPAMKQQPMYTGVSPVAPVSRSKGSSLADQYVQNRGSSAPLRTLSKEEFSIARHLPVKRSGEDEVDLVRRFSVGKNYPRSPLSGGTPYRLTII
jgi:hypothetical protein